MPAGAEQDAIALTHLLDAVESIEEPLLAWGITDVNIPRHQVLEVASKIHSDDPASLVERAIGTDLLYVDDLSAGTCDRPDCRCDLVRTRTAETLRLVANLRQLMPQMSTWRDGPRLVRDFRFVRRPRRFPDRGAVTAPNLLQQVRDDAGERGTAALEALLRDADERPLSTSAFQARAVESILQATRSQGLRGVMVTAGTGAGKTKAAYLPALSAALSRASRERRHPLILAVYPRIELLKDQMSEAFREIRKLDEVANVAIGRPLTVGAVYGDVPRTRDLSKLRRSWSRAGDARICPFLRCPRCEGALSTGDLVELACACGFTVGPDEVLLDRRSMAAAPPDVVFVTGDMLNRLLGHRSHRRIVGASGEGGPAVVLLDEVHTYEGTSGAQTAMLLRRWRHASKAEDATFVGLSATLRDAPRFLSQLTGVPVEDVSPVSVHPDELIAGSTEYLVALRNDAAAGTATLSTTIQLLMLLARCLDPDGSTEGLLGRKVFAFTDNLDVTNRLYSSLCDAEGRLIWGDRMSNKDPLAALRSPDAYGGFSDEGARHRDGQLWDLPHVLGFELDSADALPLGRTNSKDAGLDPNATVVVATASLEVGLDDDEVGAVVQHGAPRDVAQFLQRKGRAGRSPRMRPWTVVSLSQYGRDRSSYAAWDQLLDPALPARQLPVRNRYIRRMHAALAVLDWLASSSVPGLRDDEDLWMLLNGPVKPGKWRKRNRASQMAVAKHLERLLRSEAIQGELTKHIADALDLTLDEATDLLRYSPRSILHEAVPSLLQALWTEWAGHDLDRGEEGSPPTPMPGFVPPNLFSPLELPEVEILAERRDGGHTFEEGLPTDRALREFAPGNVSRRAATNEQTRSHWVPLPDPRPGPDAVQEVEVRGRFDGAVRDATVSVACDDIVCDRGCGEPHDLDVYRPKSVRIDVTPPGVSPTSRTFPQWTSRFEPAHRRTDLSLPGPDVGLVAMSFYLHAERSPAAVTRACHGADGSGLVDGEEHRYAARFLVDSKQATIGTRTFVDACRLQVVVPEDWLDESGLSDRARRGIEAAWLEERVHRRLADLTNRFRAGWLHDALVSAAATESLASRTSLGQAVEALGEQLPELLLRAVDLLLRRSDGGDVQGEPARVRDALHILIHNDAVVEALKQAAIQDDVEHRRTWLNRRLRRTFGLATLDAARRLCDDHDPEGVLLDMVGDELWMTEPSPGGLGFLEELVQRVKESPIGFSRQVERALRPRGARATDEALRAVLSSDDFAPTLDSYRSSNDPRDQRKSVDALRAGLEDHGVAATHEAVAAVAGRVLRSGTSPASDAALRATVEHLDGLEADLGLTLERRIAATVLADTPAASELARAVELPDDQPSRLDALDMMLWPSGWKVDAAALDDWNPFHLNAPTPAPDVATERIDVATSPLAASTTELTDLLATLGNTGTAQITTALDDPLALARLVSQSMAETIDLSILRLAPRLLEVHRDDRRLAATLVLPDRIERSAPGAEPTAQQTRVIRTYGDGASQPVHDVIAAVFAMELLAPSKDLIIVSPWISDVPVLDNRDGEFEGIAGDLPRRLLSLTDVLRRIARDSRCNLSIVLSDEPSNKRVRRSLAGLDSPTFRIVIDDDAHEKSLVTDHLMLSGSMNFTFGGTTRNREQLTVYASTAKVQEAHVQLAHRHGLPNGR